MSSVGALHGIWENLCYSGEGEIYSFLLLWKNNTGQSADADWPVLYGEGACLSYIFTMPLKPMKAIARIPAEMRAMGMPFIEAGSSVRESCSRIPAKTTRASVKPIAMEIA